MKVINLLLNTILLAFIPVSMKAWTYPDELGNDWDDDLGYEFIHYREYEIIVEWEDVRSNSENIIDYTYGGYISQKDSILNYIINHKDYESEYILVPRYINKPWNQSKQIIPYAKKFIEVIEKDTEVANILANIYNKCSENPKYLLEDPKEKELVKKIIDLISDPKEQKSILKDYNKGKVSSILLPYITNYYNNYVKNINVYKSEYEKLKKQPVNYIAEKFNKRVDFDKKLVYDTVPNPFERDYAYEEKYFQEAMRDDLIHDWEWIFNEKGVLVEQEYPTRVRYYKYASHPGIRRVEDMAYDDSGNLVRVIKSGEPIFIGDLYRILERHDSKGIGRQIAIWAYEDNKYDIKSQPKKVQDYITDQLGIRQLTKEEKAKSEKVAKQMANASANYMLADSRHGKNSKKSNRAKDKAAIQFLDALLEGASSYSSEGDAWFRQIEKDNEPYFESFYKLERINDTSFRGILVDEDLNPIYELIYEYTTGSKPYTVVEKIKINQLNSPSSSKN